MASTLHIIRGLPGGPAPFGGSSPTFFGPSADQRYESMAVTATAASSQLAAVHGECWRLQVEGDPVVLRIYDAAGTVPTPGAGANDLKLIQLMGPIDVTMLAGHKIRVKTV